MLEAFRAATLETFASLDEETFSFERQRTELVRSVPELRGRWPANSNGMCGWSRT